MNKSSIIRRIVSAERIKKEMICRIRKWELSDAKELALELSADENETFAFAVTADGKVIGSIGVFRQANIHRQTAELGYYIAEEYWGNGIMTEAVKQNVFSVKSLAGQFDKKQ